MAPELRNWTALLALVAAAACGTRKAEVGAVTCAPRDTELSQGLDASTLAGEYMLTLVATMGEQQGKESKGQLLLVSVDSARALARSTEAASEVPFRLVGSLDLALDQVGALQLGDIRSLDLSRPGVAVLQHGDTIAPAVTLRLGSQANQVDNTRFDGGYTALRVKWVESGGFGGSWESGARGPEAAGYFCAFRPTAGG